MQSHLDGIVFAFPGKGLQEYATQLWARGLPVALVARRHGELPYAICANAVFAELLDRPLSEIIGRDEVELYPPDYAEQFRQLDRQVVASRQTIEFEYVVEKPDRRRRFQHGKKAPLFEADGRAIGIQSLYSAVVHRPADCSSNSDA